MQPKISVVTPSFNQVKYVSSTIESVLNQDYDNVEYIVVDGGSDDGSVRVIKEYERQLAHWISEPDDGQSDAINKGFVRASGDILCWINSDDVFVQGALGAVAESLGDKVAPSWLIGSTQIVDSENRAIRVKVPRTVNQQTFIRWGTSSFPQQSTFWTRSMWDRAGPLRKDLHYTMDLALWLKMYDISAPLQVPKVLSSYRVHDQAKCFQHPAKVRGEILQVLMEHILAERQTSEAWVESCLRTSVELDNEIMELKHSSNRINKHIVIGRVLNLWRRYINQDLQ